MWPGRMKRADDNVVVVVGLGNPGTEYRGTRHNVGQEIVERVAQEAGVSFQDQRKLKAKVATIRRNDRRWLLVIPVTFMNRSGAAVQAVSAYYNATPAQIVVCHDDLDVPVGEIRLKQGGGHAGHNGLRDIDRALGTAEYLRLRIGIGRPPGRMDAAKFVLARFRSEERLIVDGVVAGAIDLLDTLFDEGLDVAQNRFHGRAL